MKVARYHATSKRIAVLPNAPAALNGRPRNISDESGARLSGLEAIGILAKTGSQWRDRSFAYHACHDFLTPTRGEQVKDA